VSLRRGLRSYEKRLVLIHVPSGPSLKGLLVKAYPDCFVLVNAESLDQAVKLGGEIVVPRGPGVWVQTVVQEQPR